MRLWGQWFWVCLIGFLCIACKQQESASFTAKTGFSGGESVLSGSMLAGDYSNYTITYWDVVADAVDSGDATAGLLQESDEPFRIVDRGPEGSLPAGIQNPNLWVVFSQPVVPLARLGQRVSETSAMSIEPALEGVFRWYGSRMLAFEAAEPALPQQEYRVSIHEELRSLGGKPLQGQRSFQFKTEALSIVNWHVGDKNKWYNTDDVPLAAAKRVSLRFSHPVDMASLMPSIKILVDGQVWPFNVEPAADSTGQLATDSAGQAALDEFLFTLAGELPSNAEISLVLQAGALSRAGAAGTEEDFSINWHSIKPFTFESAQAQSWSDPWSPAGDSRNLYIDYSHSLDPEIDFLSLVAVEGFELKKENILVWGSRLVIAGLPLDYNSNYTVKIKEGIVDIWGRRAAGIVQAVHLGEPPRFVSQRDRGSHYLEAGFPLQYIWASQNPLSPQMGIRQVDSPYYHLESHYLKNVDAREIKGQGRNFHIQELSPYLAKSGKGSLAMAWKSRVYNSWLKRYETRESWLSLQVTDLAITTRYAPNRLVLWASYLSSGQGADGLEAVLFNNNTEIARQKTRADGLAVFDFSAKKLGQLFDEPDSGYYSEAYGPLGKGLRIKLIEKGGVKKGGDEIEFIPNGSHNSWRFGQPSRSPFRSEGADAAIFMYSDRHLYRPGEELSFRLIDRDFIDGKYLAHPGPWTVKVLSNQYRSEAFLELSGWTNKNGIGSGSFTLPQDLDPGTYIIRYEREGATEDLYFKLAFFENLRFQANLTFDEGPWYLGDSIACNYAANYLAGGALSAAEYSWSLTSEQEAWRPAEPWQHWKAGPAYNFKRDWIDSGQGRLSDTGRAHIAVDTSSAGQVEGASYRYKLEVEAQDAGRQSVATSASTLVHPASFYLAGRLDAGTKEGSGTQMFFREAGKNIVFSGAVLTSESELVARAPAVEYQLIRQDWALVRQQSDGGINLVWEREEIVVETKTLSPKNGRFSHSFLAGESGQWEIRLRAQDEKGRKAYTELSFYAFGSGRVLWGSDNESAIHMQADSPQYAPGDTASVLIRSPLPKGRYLLTLEREGIFDEKIIEIEGSAASIEIPIKKEYMPIVYISLSSFTTRESKKTRKWYEKDIEKPRSLFGLLPLYVDSSSRKIDIDIAGSKSVYEPGERAEFVISARVNGKPAAGVDVGFMAVDRGILDLVNYHVKNPLDFFMDVNRFPLTVAGADSRSLLIDPVNYELKDLFGGGGDKGDDSGGGGLRGRERRDFNPCAAFEPFLVTGKDGRVRVEVLFPDSLTTYRLTAVASDIDNFGIAETEAQVSQSIVAVASLPEELRLRDTAEVSLLLTNLDASSQEVTVTLSLGPSGHSATLGQLAPLALDGPEKKSIKLGPGQSAELPFRLAALAVGQGEISFDIQSKLLKERLIKEIEVKRPLVYESFTSTGSLSGDKTFIEEALILPSSVLQESGSLSLSLSASRLSLLRGTIDYLLDYPYSCLEQKMSVLTSVLLFSPLFDAFGLEHRIADPQGHIKKELDYIAAQAQEDASLPFWPGDNYANYYVSLRFAHFLSLAGARGILPPETEFFSLDRLVEYLDKPANRPPWYGQDNMLQAYSLYVRSLYGRQPLQELQTLAKAEKLDNASRALLGLTALEIGDRSLARKLYTELKRYFKPGTRGLEIDDAYTGSQGFWGSDIERTAISLLFMASLNPEDEMLTRLTNSLVLRQNRGAWNSTSSAYWAMLALGKIAEQEEAKTTNFTAQASLRGKNVIQENFKKYGQEPATLFLRFTGPALQDLPRDSILPLRIERQGQGSLHYVASLRYALPAELMPARDEGFSVYVQYMDENGKEIDEKHLVAGRRYWGKLLISTSRDRSFVALSLPLPSGVSIDNAAFVTTARGPETEEPDKGWGYISEKEYWRREHRQFIFNNEIQWLWDYFPAGRAELSFTFRAIRPGVYPLPPAVAHCMYEEEVFGRSAGRLAIIGRESPGK